MTSAGATSVAARQAILLWSEPTSERSMPTVKYKQVETINEFIDAIRIRTDVFILEQKCPPGWEPSELDKSAEHYVAICDGEIVATARLREDPPGSQKIESMAVKRDYRGRNIGLGLTMCIVRAAQAKQAGRIWIQAQSYAAGFYERSGFQVIGDEYDLYDLGIPHVTMEFHGADQTGWPHA